MKRKRYHIREKNLIKCFFKASGVCVDHVWDCLGPYVTSITALLVVAFTNKSTIQTFSHELQTYPKPPAQAPPNHLLTTYILYRRVFFGFVQSKQHFAEAHSTHSHPPLAKYPSKELSSTYPRYLTNEI